MPCTHPFVYYLGPQPGAGDQYNCASCQSTVTLDKKDILDRIELCPKCREELDQYGHCVCGYDRLLDFPQCEECGGAIAEDGQCQDCLKVYPEYKQS